MSAPAFLVDEQRAMDAFNVHCALVKAEQAAPHLQNNPQWIIIRQDAFEAFYRAFARTPG